MTTAETRGKEKRIEELTRRELDMIYSLVRIGDWPHGEIGRRYGILERDVRKVFDNYVELREVLERNQQLPLQGTQQQQVEQPKRKKRSDAKFETPAEKQKAYRLRLKEKQRVGIEPSPISAVTDLPPPAG